MKLKSLSALVSALALSVIGIGVFAPEASAHVPKISASCDGVVVSGTNYDATKANVWTATVNGVTTSGTFGATLNKTFPVPQDGATTTWSAHIAAFDGGYPDTKSGTVGPCGVKPDVKDAAASISTTPATCTSGEILNLGTPVAAVWSGTSQGAVGPREYSVTATAITGHLFGNGDTTTTLTGSLAGPLSGEQCYVPPIIKPYIETSHEVTCGSVTVTLHNVSAWIYPVSFVVDGGTMQYGATVDNRTEGGMSGPAKDASNSKTFTFAEDSGVHTVAYRVQAGSESDLYKNKPVGEWTPVTVQSDCILPQPADEIEITYGDWTGAPTCDNPSVLQTRDVFTATAAWVEGEWKYGTPVLTGTETATEPVVMTDAEYRTQCAPKIPTKTPETYIGFYLDGPAPTCAEPVTQWTRTITVRTFTYTWDLKSRVWVEHVQDVVTIDPVTEAHSLTPDQIKACTPTVTATPTPTAITPKLAATGSDISPWGFGLGALVLIAGAAIAIYGSKKNKV